MSQPSQKFSTAEINKLVNNTIKYVLSQEYNKYPVKRADITKHAMKSAGRQYGYIISLVQKKMEHVFGLRLAALEDCQRFIVVNKFESKEMAGIIQASEKHRNKNALLMIMLAHIFMAGGVVKETDMWDILKRLKVVSEDTVHKVFGDVKKLITVEFVRQMYLALTTIEQSDPPVKEFRWGARAECEIDKEAILNFVCQMHSNMDPKQWTSQWAVVKAEKAEKQRENDAEGDSDDMSVSD